METCNAIANTLQHSETFYQPHMNAPVNTSLLAIVRYVKHMQSHRCVTVRCQFAEINR